MEAENPETFNKLIAILSKSAVAYKVTEHEPVKTSEEAAKVRGVSLASGAKAMLLKYEITKGDFAYILAVLSAAKKMNLKALKKLLGTKNIKIADASEAFNVTNCITGAIPPFGSLFGVKTYLDNSLVNQGETINFNAGLRTKSISMEVKDYIAVEQPILSDYTE